MSDSTSPNIVTVIIDTTDGPEEHEIDLDSLPIEDIANLAQFSPGIKDYYGQRLVAELRK